MSSAHANVIGLFAWSERMLAAPGAAPSAGSAWGRRRVWDRSKRSHQDVSQQRWNSLHLVAHQLQSHPWRTCSSEPRNDVAQTKCQVVCSGQGSPPSKSWTEGQRLTQLVKACVSPAQLQALLSQHAPASLNHIHVTAIATQLAHILSQPGIKPRGPQAQSSRTCQQQDSSEPTDLHRLVSQVLHLTHLQLDKLDSRGLANVLWALASCSSSLGLCTQCQASAPVLANGTIAYDSHKLNGVNGASSSTPSILNGSIVSLSGRSSRGGTGWDVSLAEWSLDVQLHTTAAGLFQRAASVGWSHFNAQQICNMLWAAGTLKLHVSEAHVHSMLAAAQERAQQLTSQGVSNLMWACAQLGIQPTSSFLDLVPEMLTHADPQAYANTLWAVAQLGLQPSASWLTDLLSRAQPRLRHFNSQALANTGWGLARVRHAPAAAWMDAFLSVCLHRLHDMQHQHWSNLLWAVATWSRLPCADPGQYQQEELQHVVAVQGDADQCWRARPSPACITTLAEHVQPMLSAIPQQELATGSKALADLGWQPGLKWSQAWVAAVEAGMHRGLHRQSLSSVITAAATWCASGQHNKQQTPHLARCLDRACSSLAQQCKLHMQSLDGDVTSSSASSGYSSTSSSSCDDHMGLQLLTALSALATTHQHNAQGSRTPGVTALLNTAKQYVVHPSHAQLTVQQAANLCWALGKLIEPPSRSWGAAVVGGVVQQCVQQLQQGMCPLSDQEFAMLVWVCQQWKAQEVAIPLLHAMADYTSQHPVPEVQGSGGQDTRGGATQGEPHSSSSPSASWVATSLAALASVWDDQPDDLPPATPTTTTTTTNTTAAAAQVSAQAMHQLALQLFQHAGRQASIMTGQQVARCLWAAARMQYRPSKAWAAAVQRRTLQLAEQGSLQQHLHLCMWSMPQLGMRPSPDEVSLLLHTCLHGGEAAGVPLVSLDHPERLCSVLMACQGWGMQPHPDWVTQVFSHPAWPACISVGDLATTQGASCSTTGAVSDGQGSDGSSQGSEASRRVGEHETHGSAESPQGFGGAGGWSASDLKQLLSHLVALQIQPPEPWLYRVRDRLLRQIQSRGSSQSVSSSPWQRSGVLSEVHVHSLGLALQLLSPQESQQVAWLLAAGQQGSAGSSVPPPEWLLVGFDTAERQLAHMSLTSMAALLMAAGRYVKVRRMAGLLDNLVTTFVIVSSRLLPAASPKQLMQVLRALASLKAHVPHSWASDVLQAVAVDDFSRLSDAQLLDLLPALVRVHCRPDRTWVSTYLVALLHRLVPDHRSADARAAALLQAMDPGSYTSIQDTDIPPPVAATATTLTPSTVASTGGGVDGSSVLVTAAVPSGTSWPSLSSAPAQLQRPAPRGPPRPVPAQASQSGSESDQEPRVQGVQGDTPGADEQQQRQQQVVGPRQVSATRVFRLPERLGAVSSALLRLDPEVARVWRAQVVLVYDT